METEIVQKKSSSLTWLFLELAIVVSVFSQIELISEVMRPSMYAVWILVILWGVVKNNFSIRFSSFTKKFIVPYVAFCSFCLIIGQFDETYLSARYLRVLTVPLLVTIAGDMYANMDLALLNRIVKLYLICSVIFAFWVQGTYFASYSAWLSAETYLFEQKNSASQIWCAAIFVAVFLIEYRSKIEKYVAYAGCFYLFVMTAVCQCRTSILGVAAAVVAYTISRSKNKIPLILVLMSLAIAAWFIPFTREFFEQAFLLNKYEGADLDTFSSGRLGAYETAFSYIWESPIIGVGHYYVDCSYISILVETGLVGFFLIEFVWVNKMLGCYRFNSESKAKIFLFFITTFYVVESLLEGYPPFGPGVSAFMFWFVTAIIINKNNNLSKNSC